MAPLLPEQSAELKAKINLLKIGDVVRFETPLTSWVGEIEEVVSQPFLPIGRVFMIKGNLLPLVASMISEVTIYVPREGK